MLLFYFSWLAYVVKIIESKSFHQKRQIGKGIQILSWSAYPQLLRYLETTLAMLASFSLTPGDG